MLLGIMALYVGAVLCVSGLRLTGQAHAPERASALPRDPTAAGAEALEAEPAARIGPEPVGAAFEANPLAF
jgi:hypothetical protein